MAERYSLYEAKARLSALVRRVREGHAVIITVHGEPVAELRPWQDAAELTLAERLDLLRQRGALQPAAGRITDRSTLPAESRHPGALKRFLEDRE